MNPPLRVLTYNVHSCVGMDGRHAPERIADVIASTEADVVCLQELDLDRARTGRIDQARFIAARLGMHFQFHPTISRETEHYGDAILSRHPFRAIRAAIFPPVPRPIPREKRGAIWIELPWEGKNWQIINTHFGLGRDERRRQAGALLADWIEPALPLGPLVVCGDFNSRPASAVHGVFRPRLSDVHHLAGRPHVRTFSTRAPLLCIDYIYASPGLAVEHLEVVQTPLARLASDHYPLLANLRG